MMTQSNPKELPDHLGGHMNKTHTDRGVLLYLKQKYNIKSMLDIGCGPGQMVQIANDRGIDAWGVDGDFTIQYHPDIKKKVTIHDFTTGPYIPEQNFDLCWTVEFLEHVEEKYIPNYMAAIQKCNYVVCTAAPPGHAGHHHVNCQPQDYWYDKFEEYGFKIDPMEINEVRNRSLMRKGFMQKTGMFFVKKELH